MAPSVAPRPMRDLRRAAHFAPLFPPHTPNPARVRRASSGRAARLAPASRRLPPSTPRPTRPWGPSCCCPPHVQYPHLLTSSPYLCPDQMPMLDFSQLTALYHTGDQLVPGAAMRNLDAASLSARLPQIMRPLCAPAARRPRPPFPHPPHPTVTPHPPSPHPTLLLLQPPHAIVPDQPTPPQLSPAHLHPPHPPSAWQHAACPSVASHRRSARVPRPRWREE